MMDRYVWLWPLMAVLLVVAMLWGTVDLAQHADREAHENRAFIAAQHRRIHELRARLAAAEEMLEQVQRTSVRNHFRLTSMAGLVESSEMTKMARLSRRVDYAIRDAGVCHRRIDDVWWAVGFVARSIPGRARPPGIPSRRRPKLEDK